MTTIKEPLKKLGIQSTELPLVQQVLSTDILEEN